VVLRRLAFAQGLAEQTTRLGTQVEQAPLR
jgi:hypothetical protein